MRRLVAGDHFPHRLGPQSAPIERHPCTEKECAHRHVVARRVRGGRAEKRPKRGAVLRFEHGNAPSMNETITPAKFAASMGCLVPMSTPITSRRGLMRKPCVSTLRMDVPCARPVTVSVVASNSVSG